MCGFWHHKVFFSTKTPWELLSPSCFPAVQLLPPSVCLVFSSAVASLTYPKPGLIHYFENSDLQIGIWLWLMESQDLMGHPKRQRNLEKQLWNPAAVSQQGSQVLANRKLAKRWSGNQNPWPSEWGLFVPPHFHISHGQENLSNWSVFPSQPLKFMVRKCILAVKFQ